MNNLTNLDAKTNFDTVDESELGLCRALWMSVAMQALIDARSNSNKPEMRSIRKSARTWIQPAGEELSDFELVCDLAGIESEVAQKRFLEIVEGSEIGVDFRCLRKESAHNKGQEQRSKYMQRARSTSKERNHKYS